MRVFKRRFRLVLNKKKWDGIFWVDEEKILLFHES